MSAPPAAVELRGLTKGFGAALANDGVNLRVARGSLHGIVGENGAGKSTAMKLLYGLLRPDAGEILVDGVARVWRSPADAIAAGLGMVHQHFLLADPCSALDNIVVGAEPRRFGLVDRRAARHRLDQLAAQYGLPVEWDRPVGDLPVGIQQRVEILKLLYRQANILILDEPTAVLTPQEVNALFANLGKLRREGKTILLITHKLREVMEFTDHVTVFRAGKVMGSMPTAETSPQQLADLMVGRKVLLNVEVPPARPTRDPALEVTGLTLETPTAPRLLSDLTLQVHHGEIVGIAGVEGNGQSELVKALLHPRDPRCRTRGGVRVLGREVSRWAPREIRDLGVAVIPEDRLREGLLPERPAEESFLLGRQRAAAFSRAGILRRQQLATAFAKAAVEFDLRPPDPHLPAGRFSGGNQQKLILAREFAREPRLIIAAQPTRGVDVGAIEFIHRRLVGARDRGAGVLLISPELEEIMTLADRILVMFNGRITAEYRRGQTSEGELGLRMGGA